MKHLPIIVKFLSIIGLFGLFTVAVSIFASSQIQKIDDSYTELLTHKNDASIWLSRSARQIEAIMGSVVELTISRTEASNQAALQSVNEVIPAFSDRIDKAIAAAPDRESLRTIKSAGLAAIAKCDSVIAAAAKAVSQDDIIATQDQYMAECRPDMDKVGAEVTAELKVIADEVTADSAALTVSATNTRMVTVASVIGGLLLVLTASFFTIRIGIVSPLKGMASVMGVIAGGNFKAHISGTDRRDEIGAMARAVEVFRDNGLKGLAMEEEAARTRNMSEAERARQAEAEKQRAAEMADATGNLARALKSVAEGDLTVHIDRAFAPDFEGLRRDFNAAVEQLHQTLRSVVEASQVIDSGSQELSHGANDLSKRTEQQAAALEETAAALEEITVNVNNSTKLAQEARKVVADANKSARESGEVVATAVNAMQRIEASSSQISNIIGVIDEIAFQTNLLALNAGVEAARAGDAGKGFAVVAQEVRELAQRSAQAAKEIKELISKSSTEVEGGVKLVRATGDVLKTIENYVATVNEHMESIAASAQEQATGLSQVNSAVNQMDQSTQQNAAMVEQSTAASASLADEAEKLRSMMQRFKLDGVNDMHAVRRDEQPAAARQHASPARRMMGKVARAFGGAKTAEAEWQNF